MSDGDEQQFDWGELGQKWWADAAAQVGATERQSKLAAALHRGCSNTAAAREAGYGGGDDAIRQSAYRAARTRAVANLMALATAEAKGETSPVVNGDECKRVLTKLIRGSDPAMRIRAIEAMQRIEDRATSFARSVDDDGFGEWRTVRDYLQMSGGAAAIVHLWAGAGSSLSALPLLHDVHEKVSATWPDLWSGLARRSSAAERAQLERHLADPSWQLAARVKLWREVGIEIETPDDWRPDSPDIPSEIEKEIAA